MSMYYTARNFTQEKIKLLQLTAGNGTLRQVPPYKTGVRFFVLDKIEELRFVFKSNLSNEQLQHPKLPKVIFMNDNNDDDDDHDNKDNAGKDADNAGGVGDVSNEDNNDDDIVDLTVELEDKRISKMCRVSK